MTQATKSIGEQVGDLAHAVGDATAKKAEQAADQSLKMGADLASGLGRKAGALADLIDDKSPSLAQQVRKTADKVGAFADELNDRKVSDLYGMIHPKANDTLTVRSVFIIDPQKKVRAMITYPASTGRNFDEILRVIDSLQLTDNHQVATPANWKDGEECVIVPSLTDPEEIKRRFPKGHRELRPYLRMTPQPNK